MIAIKMADFKAVDNRIKHKKVTGELVSEWRSFAKFGQHFSIFLRGTEKKKRKKKKEKRKTFEIVPLNDVNDGASHCRLIGL